MKSELLTKKRWHLSQAHLPPKLVQQLPRAAGSVAEQRVQAPALPGCLGAPPLWLLPLQPQGLGPAPDPHAHNAHSSSCGPEVGRLQLPLRKLGFDIISRNGKGSN